MSDEKPQKHRLVQDSAAKLRGIILSKAPGAQLGSLREVADLLGVGIVTVQQVARVLEHEGLLAVKRGPGGGYYGARPDEAALERAFDTYMRVHGFGYMDAMEMMVLLDCEFIPRAACIEDASFRASIKSLIEKVERTERQEERVQIEIEFRDLLFAVVDRPFIQLLARVTMHTTELYQTHERTPMFMDQLTIENWKTARLRIFHAIIQGDEGLARFEAYRFRDFLLPKLK